MLYMLLKSESDVSKYAEMTLWGTYRLPDRDKFYYSVQFYAFHLFSGICICPKLNLLRGETLR